MLAMDKVHDIRNDFNLQGLNITQIANKYGMDRKTVRKYIDMADFNDPDPMPKEPEFCPKLDPYKAKINEWLTADKSAPRKQRHTAKRVYDRLREEFPGFSCSQRTVSTYVAKRKKELGLKAPEGHIPLVHQPGEAQADFGAADYVEDGVQRSGKYFVLDFPYSNAGFIQLQPGENLECLLESIVDPDFKPPVEEEPSPEYVTDLGLDLRTENILTKAGIRTVKDLIATGPEAVKALPRLGKLSYKLIREGLLKVGVEWP